MTSGTVFLGKRAGSLPLGKGIPNPGWGFLKQLMTQDLPQQGSSLSLHLPVSACALAHFTELSASVLAGILCPKCKWRVFLQASYLYLMSLIYQNQSSFTFLTLVTHTPRASPCLQIPPWSRPSRALRGPESITQPSSSSATNELFSGDAAEPLG